MENNITNSFINNNDDRTGKDILTKFSGFNQFVYLDPAITGYSFVFVTKPSLFIFPQKPSSNDVNKTLAYNNMCSDPSFVMYLFDENSNERDRQLVEQLSYFQFSDQKSLFMPIFTNLVKSFNPGDVNLDTLQAFATREGYNFTLPTNTVQSEASSSMTLTVSETNNFDFTKITSLWVKYISNVTNGTFTANPEMIKQNMLDYMSSIYYFLIAPDGRTLKYWCRYTGCYPLSVPYSNLSFQKGSIDSPQFDLSFQYTLKEDMNPKILEDFNILSLKLVTPELFVDLNYDNFVKETIFDTDSGHEAFMSSPLLSKSQLFNGNYKNLVESDDRDPLVMYEDSSDNKLVPGITPGKYILSFSKNTLKNDLYNSLVMNDSAFNYETLLDSLQ